MSMTVASYTQIGTAERLALLQKRRAELLALIAAGDATEAEILEEQELVKRVVATERVHSDEQGKQYRARVQQEADERRERLNAVLDELASLTPRYLLALADFTNIADEIQQRGLGFDGGGEMEALLGLPPDFGSRVIREIRAAAPKTEWDFAGVGPFAAGVKADRPKLRAERGIILDPRAGMGPPPGYSGRWNFALGRPDESEA
ncbi:hypothetical protein BH23GEM2_BH23GEM2_14860 [soil metagenome]